MEAAHSRTGSLAVRRRLTALRKQLRALDGDRADNALLWTKQTFYVGGDKAGRLLVHRLRMQATSRRVTEVHLPDGTLTSQKALILQQFKRFYSELYSTEELESQDIEDYLDFIPLSQIPPAESAILEKFVTPREVLETIHCLQTGKAPGADGFGAEFYKAVGAQLAPVLARLYNVLTRSHPPPPTMQLGMVIVIPKPRKDPQLCSSYRPLLLNVDTQIFTVSWPAR
ncbi:hypothetical protein NDU88_005934 [Pleurodeles waltl]|uniref:Uncharacterized protein n=1 Tax=Pleurodeles waltl TaxID=8319 RepID=A0AAV7WD91_PLEWA|nr:hypothetical protein NDU88_005934 [Pleurodeles waltl]